MKKHFRIASIVILFCQFGFAQSAVSPQNKIDNIFCRYGNETPGVAVAIVENGKVVFSKGYGMANLEYNIPITPRTIFHVASVSKQFTAFSIYLLEKQGKISLEDDIRKYIPELPDYGKTIKIKHLLAHTSGLRDQWALLTLAGWHLEDVITTDQILKLAIKQKKLNFETGTAFGYCNTSFTLLSETIKRITGKSFAAFTKEYIFEPLNMSDTQFYDDFQKIVKNRAYSYEIRNNTYIKKELNYSNVGPTSLFTTIEDLAKWTNNFSNPIVGDVELINAFNKISFLDNNKPVIYHSAIGDTTYHAKGQLHWYYKGVKVISHGGHDAGFRAFLARFPENNLAIIALSNDEHYEILNRGLEMADIYLNGQLKETPITENPPPQNMNDLAEDIHNTLPDFEGEYYSDELTTKYKVIIKNNKLILTHNRLSDMELSSIGIDKFSGINYFPFELEFLRSQKSITGLKISNFGAKNIPFEKL